MPAAVKKKSYFFPWPRHLWPHIWWLFPLFRLASSRQEIQSHQRPVFLWNPIKLLLALGHLFILPLSSSCKPLLSDFLTIGSFLSIHMLAETSYKSKSIPDHPLSIMATLSPHKSLSIAVIWQCQMKKAKLHHITHSITILFSGVY